MTSQSRQLETSITEQSLCNNSIYKPKSLSDNQIKQQITITECLCDQCTGQYTDKLTQSLKVVCTDPKHFHEQEDMT